MQSMSEDDAAYAALLTELFSDSTPDRDARVYSWIQQQYGFAVSDWERFNYDSLIRPPSPSPSSSFGAHRTYTPESVCSFHDALFFPTPDQNCEEQIRALRSIVQQMALHMSRTASQSPCCSEDKPLPALPPSPTTPLHRYTSSDLNRSRSSLTRVSCPPSAILSSEQAAQEIHPSPSPFPLVDGYVYDRDEPFSCSNIQSQEQDGQLSCHVWDYRDYVPRSPTASNYSFANSRKTSFTTLSKSSPVSPTDAIFLASPRSGENINIAHPASSVNSQAFLREPTTSPPETCEHTTKQSSPLSKSAIPHPPSPSPFTISLSTTNEAPASPVSCSFPASNGAAVGDASQNPGLCTLKFAEHSQSRWSIATTATGFVASPNVESNSTSLLKSRATSKKMMDVKLSATPPKRNRFMNIISRFSQSPAATASTKITTIRKRDDSVYDSANDGETKEKNKMKKMTLSGKSSLASIRTSLSLSRASFGSLRSPVSSSTEEVPPLPRTSTRTPSFALPLDVSPPKTKISTGKNLTNSPSIQPITPSEPVTQISQGSSQSTSSNDPTSLAPASRIYLACASTTPNGSRISLLSPQPKQMSLPSAECVQMMAASSPVSTDRETIRSKSIVRSTEKTNGVEKSSVLSAVSGIRFPPPSTTVHSTTSSVAMEFTIPAKLASAMATQSPRAPAFSGPDGQSSPQSALKTLPSSTLRKVPQHISDLPKEHFPCLLPTSSLSPSGLHSHGGACIYQAYT